MLHHRIGSACVLGIAMIAIVCSAVSCGSDGASPKSVESTPPVKNVNSAEQAAREANDVDLPLLKSATRAVLEEMKPRGARVTLDKAADLEQLRQALKPSDAPPSAGEIEVRISFYRGDELLRKAWVYRDGEWGFERPGVGWVTGREDRLWRVIQSHLKTEPIAEPAETPHAVGPKP